MRKRTCVSLFGDQWIVQCGTTLVSDFCFRICCLIFSHSNRLKDIIAHLFPFVLLSQISFTWLFSAFPHDIFFQRNSALSPKSCGNKSNSIACPQLSLRCCRLIPIVTSLLLGSLDTALMGTVEITYLFPADLLSSSYVWSSVGFMRNIEMNVIVLSSVELLRIGVWGGWGREGLVTHTGGTVGWLEEKISYKKH